MNARKNTQLHSGANPIDPEVSERLDAGEKPAYRWVKRAFDIVFSAGVLAVGSWLYVLVGLLIKVDNPDAPVIFKQVRIGKDGKPFTIYKFRSMAVGAEDQLEDLWALNQKDGPVFKMRDDPRVTRVGRWLRKTSLDELPQFVNVLRGDMSVVGPRPALPCEVARYSERDRLRLRGKPGITCYWQIQPCRDDISFSEWVDLDLQYLRTQSVMVDLKIIGKTVVAVATAQGS